MEAGAGHGDAEAVADADVEVGRGGADGPFEFRVSATGCYAGFSVHGATDEHGTGVGEADAADWFLAERGGGAAGSAVPPVVVGFIGGFEGDADAVAAATGAAGIRISKGTACVHESESEARVCVDVHHFQG